MIVLILKMCNTYFVHISWIFSHFWGVLNLDIFPSKMLRWCLVCVIFNSNSTYGTDKGDAICPRHLLCPPIENGKGKKSILADVQQKVQVGMCAHQRLRSAFASTKSDQSSIGTLWLAKGPTIFQPET